MTIDEMTQYLLACGVKPRATLYNIGGIHLIMSKDGKVYSGLDYEFWGILERELEGKHANKD